MSLSLNNISFEDNPAITGRADQFETRQVNSYKVLKSWRNSIFSFEWLNEGGKIRPIGEMKTSEQEKRRKIETLLQKNTPLVRPVLGLGICDHIEIGAGRDVFLTLTANGLTQIPVHIPKSCLEEFAAFLAE